MSTRAEYLIRRATIADAASIARLANLLGKQSGGSGDAMTAEKVTQDLLGPESGLQVAVAELAGDVVGYAMHSVAYETAYGERGGYLSDLFVAEDARGRGIGRALMAFVAQCTTHDGGTFLWWVSARSARVKAFAVTGARFDALKADATEPRKR